MLRNHSHYSLLNSTSRCDQIVDACIDHGVSYAGLTDIFTVAGAVKFIIACKKKNVKPIIGCDIILDNGSYLTLICKNQSAWKELLQLISKANEPSNYKDTPKISFSDMYETISADNFVAIDGYLNSEFFAKIFSDTKCIFDNLESEDIRLCMNPDWKQRCYAHISHMKSIFPNYYLELSPKDSSFSIDGVLHDCVKTVDPDGDITIPDTSSYYPNRDDSVDHRVIIASKLKTTLKNLDSKIYESENIELLRFIKRNNYHIKKVDQNKNLLDIVGMCEEIDILSKPRLPHFICPENMDQDDYLKHLCREGWKKLLLNNLPDDQIEVYKNRVIHELDVIKRADLAGYFLIVQDYVNHFRNKGVLVGPARGSAAGSLVCYLIGITLIDPIKYGLVFSRFYNPSRSIPDHISFDEFKFTDFLKNI